MKEEIILQRFDKLDQVAVENQKRFNKLDKAVAGNRAQLGKLDKAIVENRKRSDKLYLAIVENRKRLDAYDKRFDEIDKQFDRNIDMLMVHDDRLAWLEENVATKADFHVLLEGQDAIIKILSSMTQEKVFTDERLKRHDTQIEKNRQDIQVLQKNRGIA